jgi:hypothetical protein
MYRQILSTVHGIVELVSEDLGGADDDRRMGLLFAVAGENATFSSPNSRENSTYLALERAFRGEAYQLRWPPASLCSMALRAIQVLPAPVGAVTSTSPDSSAAKASCWKGSGTKGAASGTPIWSSNGTSWGDA